MTSIYPISPSHTHTNTHTHQEPIYIERNRQSSTHKCLNTHTNTHTHKHSLSHTHTHTLSLSLSHTHPQTLSLSLSQTHTAHTQKLCSNFDPPGRQAHYHLQLWLSFWEITISLYCVPRDNSCSLQKALSYFQRDES